MPLFNFLKHRLSQGGGARDSIAGYGKKESLMLLEGESTTGLDSMSVAGTPELVMWQRRSRHMKKQGQKASSKV